ncbi:protein SWOLLEN 1-like isoform X2 [Curcuma longa]|uniref:protein SWOLLEN 1-like isoform X2 n=1 Tax=Curcuma longa TaxID=136217 RepID=UPI003D9E6B0B
MDCDDSDFQSQNFQLIGEDNDGFPQSLQSYDPPKFDIDDHFQSHLRFDSLAESRLFLGIQGEENNWIEEFSPRHSTAEFGSSALQTCSTTGNDVWSDTPSEFARMPVKSLGDNEVNAQNMNTQSEIHPKEDSAKDILGLSDDIARTNQHGVSLQTPIYENSDSVLNINLSDQKYHAVGEVVDSEFTTNVELTSSSVEVPKACLVSGELLEVVQSKDVLDNSSAISSFDDCGRAVNRRHEMSATSVPSNSQNCSLALLTNTASTEASKLGNSSLTEPEKVDCHTVNVNKNSESSQSENKQSETFSIVHGEHNSLDQALNNDVCAIKDSSGMVPPIDSLVLENEGSHDTVLSEKSDGLLEAIAYQVKSLNKDSKTEDKRSTDTAQLPSLAKDAGKNFVEAVTEKRTELSDIAAGPINSPALLLEESQPFCSGEQRDFDTSKRVIIGDNKWKIDFSSAVQTEITAVEDDTGSQMHPLTTHNLDILQRAKNGDNKSLKDFTEKVDASEQTVPKQPSALLEGAENKTSSSHGELDPISETACLVAESNVDNISHLEEKDNSTQSVGSNDNKLKDHCPTTENTQLSSSETQDHGVLMDSDETSIKDQTENTQLLRSEVEVIIEEKEIILSSSPDSHSDGKDAQAVSLSVVNFGTTSETLGGSNVMADSDAKGPSVENFSDEQETTKSDEVQVAFSTGAFSLSTCKSTEQEDASLAPTNHSDKPKHTDIEFDTSKIGTNSLSQLPLPEGNLESSSFDPQGGKPSSYDTNCGSPTIISCKEWILEERNSTQYRERNSLLQNFTGSSLEAPKFDSFKGTVQDPKMSTLGDDENFTFIVPLLKNDTPEDTQEFTNTTQSLEQPQISTEISHEHSSDTVKETTINPSMSVEDKKNQASARATRKAGISKGNANEKSQEKHAKGSKRTPRSTFSRALRNKISKEDVQQGLHVDTNTMKSSCSPNVQTSNLLDMSTSAPLFHQPFTDLQQVQLRAQIFVYGSLIQGVLPDEACMLPAFGGTDGGRSLWEKTWRAASERFHNKKSLTSSSEQGVSCSPLSSKALNSSAGRRDSKTPIAATKSSIVSFQSPFQKSSKDVLPSNITRGTYLESNQSPLPLHSYQTSQMRQYLTNSTPWFSPSPPHHASWVVPSQGSPFDSAAHHSSAIASETSQVTPARDTSKSHAANMQLTSPSALLPRQDAPSISAVLPSEIQNKEATPAGNKSTSIREKSRKRKKISALEEPVLNISTPQPQPDSASATYVTSNVPSFSSLPRLSSSLSPSTSVGFVSTTSQAPTAPYYQILGSSSPQTIFSKETCTHIEQSKVQADSASASAAAAVKHSQTIWEQMTVQKSGLPSEVEGKLVSAAVAAAAAASVAKAAAEVAKVASEAALQAKLMADEAVNSSYAENGTQCTESSLDIGKSLLTSAGKDNINGLSVISAAREATRRRVEASSAAMKRAENLDAILKAAEMAAEAVSQVGTIIAMGDPLPFSINEIVEAGPDVYWKRHRTTKIGAESNLQPKNNSGLFIASDHELYTKQQAELASDQNTRKDSIIERSSGNQESISSEEHYEGHELTGREKILSTGRGPTQGSTIQTGSHVEVVAEEGGLQGAWFSAFVVDIKDSKAYVQYQDLPSDEGHEKLKEWIQLESKGDQPPRIRVAHSIMVGIPEGTRKRRRGALGNFNWAVGDRVDAWMRDRWWEGVVTDKNPDDETKLTVHFSGGDLSVVRAWNLRPSLIWEDGQWIEWSRAKEKVSLETYEGDTPQEKRQKLWRLENKSKEEIIEGGSNTHTNDSSKLEETNPLNLSAKDVMFSMGKNVGEGNNNDAFKVKRAGLQKDGSKVVFGVPKPGKKQKFMEVSKHYTADKTEKAAERSDSMKFAKYLIPQASQSWRHNSKAETKGKQTTNLNTRVLKSLRSQNVQVKSTVDKDKLVTSASVSNGVEVSLKTSFSTGEKKDSMEIGSLPHIIGKVDVAVLEPSAQPVQGIPASKKKSSSLEVEIEEKEKGSSGVELASGSEVQGSENIGKRSDVIEPRRSNRRIQPTSRLLEGLQSSLLISKIPSFSHDKGTKNLHKGQSQR